MKLAALLVLLLVGVSIQESEEFGAMGPVRPGFRRRKWKKTVIIIDKRDATSNLPFICTFNRLASTISCPDRVKLNATVNCKVESKLNVLDAAYWKNYAQFGIEKHAPSAVSVIDHFHLYPNELSSPLTWLNTTLSADLHLAIHHKPSTYYSGLRVINVDCWNRLIALFNGIVKSDLIAVKDVTGKVNVFGYIQIAE